MMKTPKYIIFKTKTQYPTSICVYSFKSQNFTFFKTQRKADDQNEHKATSHIHNYWTALD